MHILSIIVHIIGEMPVIVHIIGELSVIVHLIGELSDIVHIIGELPIIDHRGLIFSCIIYQNFLFTNIVLISLIVVKHITANRVTTKHKYTQLKCYNDRNITIDTMLYLQTGGHVIKRLHSLAIHRKNCDFVTVKHFQHSCQIYIIN